MAQSNNQYASPHEKDFLTELSGGQVIQFKIEQNANMGGEYLRLKYTMIHSDGSVRSGQVVPLPTDWQFPLGDTRLLESSDREKLIREGECKSIVKRYTKPPKDGVYWYKTTNNTILRYRTKNTVYQVIYSLEKDTLSITTKAPITDVPLILMGPLQGPL